MSEDKRKQKPEAAGEVKKDPQKEQRKKLVLAVMIMAVPFLGVMYLIFGGGEKKTAPGEQGFNMTVPDGRSPRIEASKQKALERVAADSKQQAREQEQNSFSFTPDDD